MANPLELGLMTGVDLPIPDCPLIIHQPTIKEISMLGENKFRQGLQVLSVDKTLDESALQDTTNFNIFMTILSDERTKELKGITLDTLTLFFPKYKVTLTPRALLFNLNDDNIIIDEDNFEQLQAIIRQICCLGGKDGEAFNPANDAAAEIAKKLKRGRERVAAQKEAENDGSVFALYVSILTVALELPLSELINWTIYQIYDVVERYSMYVAYDIDLRTRLAGGKPESQPDNWMKVIH